MAGIMADGEGWMLAPGQVCVQVEFDYQYKAKDKLVSIRQGECYVLVKKTNEDWWQVREDEGTKAFYVPAQYVREVRRALVPPRKPGLRTKPTLLEIHPASDENLNTAQVEMSSFGRPSPSSSPSPSSDGSTPPALPKDPNQNVGSPHRCKVVAELVLLHNNNNNQLHSTSAPQPGAVPPSRSQDRGPRAEKAPPPAELPARGHNQGLARDSESGDELSSSSTEQVRSSLGSSQAGSSAPAWCCESPSWMRRRTVAKEIWDTPLALPGHLCDGWQPFALLGCCYLLLPSLQQKYAPS